MQGRNAQLVSFQGGKKGVRLEGRIEQGSIRDGDEIQIEGHQGTIYEVVSPTGKGHGVAGQEVSLAIITDWELNSLSITPTTTRIEGMSTS